MMLYHGGTVFGRAAHDRRSLAKTILAIKIVCMLGGPAFMSKMIPVTKPVYRLNTSVLVLSREQSNGTS